MRRMEAFEHQPEKTQARYSIFFWMSFVAIFLAGTFLFYRHFSSLFIAEVNTEPETYIVTEGARLEDGTRKTTHFSILHSDGSLINTVNAPDDLVEGAGNVKIVGQYLYYLSGSREITSISAIDLATGKTIRFPFTRTVSTNAGNTLFAITGWNVSRSETLLRWSDDDRYDTAMLAWMGTDGVVSVSDHRGRAVRAYDWFGPSRYDVGFSPPLTQGWTQFDDDTLGLYVWAFDADRNGIRRVNLLKGNTSDWEDLPWNASFALSDSGKIFAYHGDGDAGLTIKALSSREKIIAPIDGFDYVGGIAFSPHEQKILFSPATVQSGPSQVEIVNVDGTDRQVLVNDAYAADFLSDHIALVYKDEMTYAIDIDGEHLRKISDEWFIGIASF